MIALDDGSKIDAILQDIQFHPVSDKILHVDFFQLKEDKEISMDIPVQLEGAAPGVLISGGVLRLNKRKLRVKALPAKLPDLIKVDISSLELGGKIYTTELKNDDYTLLHTDNTVVCQVRTARTSILETVEATDAEEGAEEENAAEASNDADAKSEE